MAILKGEVFDCRSAKTVKTESAIRSDGASLPDAVFVGREPTGLKARQAPYVE